MQPTVSTTTNPVTEFTTTHAVPVQTKRGINLGCGRILMPCAKPAHHALLPDELYTDPAIAWDNVDVIDQPGLAMVVDLFDYPWHDGNGDVIPPGTYDVALATHLCEHIPHGVKRNGIVTATHGGWWAWFDELARVLKPGGIVHIIVPYGRAYGGIVDPTHTRYLIPETFGYFSPDPNAPFDYDLKYRWDAISPAQVLYTELANFYAVRDYGEVNQDTLRRVGMTYNNVIAEFSISLRCSRA